MIHEIVTQYAENASFLWLLRDASVCRPDYSLDEISELDDRIEAHLDGVRVGQVPAWEICAQQLNDVGEVGDVFAAGALALESSQKSRIDQVIQIAASVPELERGLISAAGWIESPAVANHLYAFLASSNPAVRRIGLAGYAVRRQDPGPLLARSLNDDQPRVRARALKAVAELGRGDLLSIALQHIRDPDDDCRFYAAWTAARFAQRYEPVIGTLVEFAEKPGPRQLAALGMALRSLDLAAAKAWLRRLGPVPQTLRLATVGIGLLGDPEMMPVLFELMKNDDVARVAGESFSMITGVDHANDHLDRDRPEGFESGPTEDPADENVAMDEDENLPWPNLELIAKWWGSNAGRFQPGRRFLCGSEIGIESARQTLVDGKQRQRAAAAIELAIRQPATPLFEVRARGAWQQQWLGPTGRLARP
jgi:uncharacterized protein (TIGR02270 family)